MKIKYQMNNWELIIELSLKKELIISNDLNYLYNFLNLFFKIRKIRFKGQRILINVNGLFKGTIYLTSYYWNKKRLLDRNNCYFLENKIMEISPH